MKVAIVKAIWSSTPKEFFKRILYNDEIYDQNSDQIQTPLANILLMIVSETSHIFNEEQENVSQENFKPSRISFPVY